MSAKIKWEIKRFNALSIAELYSVLQLRSKVFVVEQNCVYQDVDGKDFEALHVLGKDGEKIVAYARLFAPAKYFDNASIGRVVVDSKYRSLKLGHDLMRFSIEGIFEEFETGPITISAQLYLEKFYNQHGFLRSGEPYLEDGIPHIKMTRN